MKILIDNGHGETLPENVVLTVRCVNMLMHVKLQIE